jgi:hypothetical protein
MYRSNRLGSGGGQDGKPAKQAKSDLDGTQSGTLRQQCQTTQLKYVRVSRLSRLRYRQLTAGGR